MRHIEGRISEEMKNYVDESNVSGSDGLYVESFGKLVEHTASLAYLNKDYLLFYRGQNNDYRNKSNKSTFYPSIYRGDYLSKREIAHRFDILNQSANKLVDILSTRVKDGKKELKQKKYIQWSILQHYEVCGTPLVDFTHSLRVACSFAQLDNTNEFAYIYVFGLPYITNRISINSEHDLVNIRLLSICPPDALRPYYQEGYLAATSDVETEYDSKSELDFNRRLIMKFRIPNDTKFWGKDFSIIPKTALYPQNDLFLDICKEIEIDAKRKLMPGEIGEFLSAWSEIENKISHYNHQDTKDMPFMYTLNKLKENNRVNPSLINNIDKLRRFRNEIVHKPTQIKSSEILEWINLLDSVKNELK
ncbi:MAG: FRG domain-containing protein [Sulfuricurvum sp.]